MGLREDARSQILAAVGSRMETASCQLCRANSWTLADGFVSLGLQEDFASFQVGGPALPCVALVCNNCGNTCLINLMTIGLQHLTDRVQVQEKQAM